MHYPYEDVIDELIMDSYIPRHPASYLLELPSIIKSLRKFSIKLKNIVEKIGTPGCVSFFSTIKCSVQNLLLYTVEIKSFFTNCFNN